MQEVISLKTSRLEFISKNLYNKEALLINLYNNIPKL